MNKKHTFTFETEQPISNKLKRRIQTAIDEQCATYLRSWWGNFKEIVNENSDA